MEFKELPVQVSWPLRDGWPYQYSSHSPGSEFIVADLDRDGSNEVVLGQTNALTILSNLASDGSVWTTELPPQTESWAIGNLDDDADLEIIGYRSDNGPGVNEHKIFAFNRDGTTVSGVWHWDLDRSAFGEHGRLTLAHLDDDGISEIVSTSFKPDLFVLRGDGSLFGPTWPVNLGSLRNLQTSVADINRDEQMEIIVPVGGFDGVEYHAIHAYQKNGRMLDGWPFALDEPPWSVVVVGDLTGSGTMEVVFTTYDAQVVALDDHGNLLPGWPVQLPFDTFHQSVALGDLNQDGRPEVIVAGDFTPYVFAFDYSGAMVDGWPAVVDREAQDGLSFINFIQAIGDINGDQLPEVVVGTQMGPYIFKHDGTRLAGAAPLLTNTSALAAYWPGNTSIADLDQDGNVEMVISMSGNAFVYDFKGKTSDIQWARYRSDLGNTGAYQPADCNNNHISDRWEIVSASVRDCNLNDVPDDCDLFGDADADGSVGLADVATLLSELTGPSGFIECSMLDADSDIDLTDFATIQRAFRDSRR